MRRILSRRGNLGQGHAVHGHTVTVQNRHQFPDDLPDSARLVKIIGIGNRGRIDFHDLRHITAVFFEEFRHHFRPQSQLISQRGQMNDGIGRSAGRIGQNHGIFNGFFIQNIAGGDTVLHELHDSLSGVLRHPQTVVVECRNRSSSRRCQAHDLTECTHGIGRSEERAAAAGGHTGLLHAVEFALRNFALFQQADRFGHGSRVGASAVQDVTAHHRTARNQNGRDIEPGCRHQHARNDFVTGAEQDNRVQAVCHHHHLNARGNQVPRRQYCKHAVALCNSVAGSDGSEFDGCPAGPVNTASDILADLPQIVVSRNDFIPGIGDADHRAFQILIRQADALIECPVIAVLRALHHISVRSKCHIRPPFLFRSVCSGLTAPSYRQKEFWPAAGTAYPGA